MKYDKKDRAKIVALAVILIVLWLFIGVRFAVLSRAHKAEQRAQEAKTAELAKTAAGPSGSTAGAVSPALRLAALVAPVAPPKNDPFHPVIPPRSTSGTSEPRPTAQRSTEQSAAPPVLPPMPSSSSGASDRNGLQLTGIIMGTPSTAVLRLGDDHFVVREGDTLDTNLRVQKITKTTVTLRDGQSAYTLRLGG